MRSLSAGLCAAAIAVSTPLMAEDAEAGNQIRLVYEIQDLEFDTELDDGTSFTEEGEGFQIRLDFHSEAGGVNSLHVPWQIGVGYTSTDQSDSIGEDYEYSSIDIPLAIGVSYYWRLAGTWELGVEGLGYGGIGFGNYESDQTTNTWTTFSYEYGLKSNIIIATGKFAFGAGVTWRNLVVDASADDIGAQDFELDGDGLNFGFFVAYRPRFLNALNIN